MYHSRYGDDRDERDASRRVIQDDVDDDADTAAARCLDETIEVRQRAEHRIDILVIADVVAEVDLR
jgi:hypothetical protein